MPQLLSSLLNSIARPFWRIEYSIKAGTLNSVESLTSSNEELKRQLEEANIRLESVRDIEIENQELKSLMGRASTTQKILAAVLAKPPYLAYDTIVIDAGYGYGFSTSSKVYAASNIAIGRVVDISNTTSKVLLYSSPGQRYDVFIGSNRLPAVAYGRGGGQYYIQLPRGVNIVEGDTVIAPFLNNRILGTVTSIKSDPAEPFETIFFAPPINIYSLRWVLVDSQNKR